MTDKEIIKALECCNNRDIEGSARPNCYDCPMTSYCHIVVADIKDGRTLLFAKALDLINRQNVEIEKAWELFEKKSDENIEMQKLCDKQKAKIAELREDNREKFDAIQDLKIFTEKQDVEIEILNSNYEKLHIKYDNALNDSKYYKRLHETAKSEAVKEFAERLKELYAKYEAYETLYAHYIWNDIDNLVNQLYTNQQR